MEHHSSQEHIQTTSSGRPILPFEDSEVQALHAADKKAGTFVIGLMLGIFTIGLVLYSTIWAWVAGS